MLASTPPNNGDKDAFVHISAVEKASLGSPNEGDKSSYEGVQNRGKGGGKSEGRLIRPPRVHGRRAMSLIRGCARGRFLQVGGPHSDGSLGSTGGCDPGDRDQASYRAAFSDCSTFFSRASRAGPGSSLSACSRVFSAQAERRS